MVSRFLVALAMAGGSIYLSPALTQEKPAASASVDLSFYDIKREVSLLGTVESFTPAADTAPAGARLILQTSGGIVDVHLGDARFLEANHFSIQSGDTLRVIGEKVVYGNSTQFLARVVLKGTKVLEVRSVRGLPLSYMAPRQDTRAKSPGGVQ
jgi:hypothetical protein